MRPDDDVPPASQPTPSQTSRSSPGSIRLWQVRAITVVGALAVVTFLCSLLLDGSAASTLRTVATVAAACCAVIGVSFAVTGNRS